jgi:hypothetical protein
MNGIARFVCTARWRGGLLSSIPMPEGDAPVGEPAEQAAGAEAPGPAVSPDVPDIVPDVVPAAWAGPDTVDARAEDAALDEALRELFLVPKTVDAAESHVALISWCRPPGLW